jgi:DegV family protein with EDD domain
VKERRVTIVTDAGADLPPADILQLRYGVGLITQIPLGIASESVSFLTDDTSANEKFRDLIDTGVIPKTSAMGPGHFEKIYRELAKNGQKILSLHLGENISSTITNAREAAREIGSDIIETVDLGTATMAQGLMAIAAEETAMNGENRDNILNMLNGLKKRVTLRVITPNFAFLQKSGRVKHLTAMLGSVLRIYPILQIDNSVVDNVAKPSTRKSAVDWLINFTNTTGTPERIAILDFEAEQTASMLYLRLIEDLKIAEKTIYRGMLGPVTATHGGPGTVAMAVQWEK